MLYYTICIGGALASCGGTIQVLWIWYNYDKIHLYATIEVRFAVYMLKAPCPDNALQPLTDIVCHAQT